MVTVYSTPFLSFPFPKHHHALAINTVPLAMKTEREINTEKTFRSWDGFKYRISRPLIATYSIAWLLSDPLALRHWRCSAFNNDGKPSTEIQRIIDKFVHAVCFQCFTFSTLDRGCLHIQFVFIMFLR